MDYDYYDESRTRFQVQSGQHSTEPEQDCHKKLNTIEVGACISIAVLLLCFAWKNDGWAQFALLWIGLSLLAGPFAPLSSTGGDCRVGVGETLTPEVQEQPVEDESRSSGKNSRRSAKGRENVNHSRSEYDRAANGSKNVVTMAMEDNNEILDLDNDDNEEASLVDCVENSDNVKFGSDAVAMKQGLDEKWTAEDLDLLKKLMVKNPRGKLRRWEVISEGFNGRHSVESIVKISKDLSERSKVGDDSYSQFLAKRKTSSKEIDSTLTQRWDVDDELGDDKQSGIPGSEMLSGTENDKKRKEWSETEDKALLNALRTFPKDTPMRWEKVAIAVPGRTKPQCFRRYSELKDSFRNKQMEDNKAA